MKQVKMLGCKVAVFMRRGIKKVMKGDKFGAPSLNIEISCLIFLRSFVIYFHVFMTLFFSVCMCLSAYVYK